MGKQINQHCRVAVLRVAGEAQHQARLGGDPETVDLPIAQDHRGGATHVLVPEICGALLLPDQQGVVTLLRPEFQEDGDRPVKGFGLGVWRVADQNGWAVGGGQERGERGGALDDNVLAPPDLERLAGCGGDLGVPDQLLPIHLAAQGKARAGLRLAHRHLEVCSVVPVVEELSTRE